MSEGGIEEKTKARKMRKRINWGRGGKEKQMIVRRENSSLRTETTRKRMKCQRIRRKAGKGGDGFGGR